MAAILLRFAPRSWRLGIVIGFSAVFVGSLGWRAAAFSGLCLVTAQACAWQQSEQGRVFASRVGVGVILIGLLLANPWRLPDLGQPGMLITTIGAPYLALQAIGQIVDLRRGAVNARAVTPLELVASMTFFPHFFAGPVLRTGRFRAELRKPDWIPLTADRSWQATSLIVTGYAKKRFSDLLVSPNEFSLALTQPGRIGAVALVVLTAIRVLSVYLATWGYIDIVRGVSCAMGLDMPRHFVAPVFGSTGLRDFFRRWQVTIMSWFRDYVMVPVRGSAPPGSLRRKAAVPATFLVAAIWHGPALVLWGVALAVGLWIESSVVHRRSAPPGWIERTLRRTLFVWVPIVGAAMLVIELRSKISGRGWMATGPAMAGVEGRLFGLLLAAGGAVWVWERLDIAHVERESTVRSAVALGGGAIVIVLCSAVGRQVFTYGGG